MDDASFHSGRALVVDVDARDVELAGEVVLDDESSAAVDDVDADVAVEDGIVLERGRRLAAHDDAGAGARGDDVRERGASSLVAEPEAPVGTANDAVVDDGRDGGSFDGNARPGRGAGDDIGGDARPRQVGAVDALVSVELDEVVRDFGRRLVLDENSAIVVVEDGVAGDDRGRDIGDDDAESRIFVNVVALDGQFGLASHDVVEIVIVVIFVIIKIIILIIIIIISSNRKNDRCLRRRETSHH